MRIAVLLFFLLQLSGNAFAQSGDTLSLERFMTWIRENHPVALQIDLQQELADQERRAGRGVLDPKLYGSYNEKKFSDQTYYNLQDYGLKIPTWFGIDFKAGFESNRGNYLNPQNTVPQDGLYGIGVSAPILKDLWYNDRRATVQKANLIAQSTRQEARIMANRLYLEAMVAYFSWTRAEAEISLFENASEVARERFIATKRGFTTGSKPAIDTLEAHIQWQTRITSLNEAKMGLIAARNQLNNYLWLEGETPVELAENTHPEKDPDLLTPFGGLSTMGDSAWIESHPEIRNLEFYRDGISIDRKVAMNNLLPELRLDYTLLNGTVTPENPTTGWETNNYKFLATASFPLFLRKERGQLGKLSVKEEQANLKLNQKRWALKNKFNAQAGKVRLLRDQVTIVRNNARDYSSLYQAEIRKFNMGESTLFLVNSREQKTLEAYQKLLETEWKLRIAWAELGEIMAQLPNIY
ncbi:MAG: TolC family protein [Bacteroidota bacterium]|nr:TolC family protein [Bacteroidota bacterium]